MAEQVCKTQGCDRFSTEYSTICRKCEERGVVAKSKGAGFGDVKPAKKTEPTCKVCNRLLSVCLSGFNYKQNTCKSCMNRKYIQARRKREKTKIKKTAAKPAAKPKESIEVKSGPKPENLLIDSFHSIYDALAPLTGSERERVLKAVDLLLEENYGAE